MNLKALLIAPALIVILMLSGCPFQDSSSLTVEERIIAGKWRGAMTNTLEETDSLVMALHPDNKAWIVNINRSQVHMAGEFEITDTTLTASLSTYFENQFTELTAMELEFVSDDRIEGTWQTATDHGTLYLERDTTIFPIDRPAELSEVIGLWNKIQIGQDGDVTATLGTCQATGTLNIPDPEMAMFGVSLEISDCEGFNGTYEGALFTDAIFLLLTVNNAQHAFTVVAMNQSDVYIDETNASVIAAHAHYLANQKLFGDRFPFQRLSNSCTTGDIIREDSETGENIVTYQECSNSVETDTYAYDQVLNGTLTGANYSEEPYVLVNRTLTELDIDTLFSNGDQFLENFTGDLIQKLVTSDTYRIEIEQFILTQHSITQSEEWQNSLTLKQIDFRVDLNDGLRTHSVSGMIEYSGDVEVEGAFQIYTATPLTFDEDPYLPISGKMIVMGASTIQMEILYQPDSVTVTYADQAPLTFSPSAYLEWLYYY